MTALARVSTAYIAILRQTSGPRSHFVTVRASGAKRISRPYGQAVGKHFDGERPTYTERVLGRLSRGE